MLRWIRRRACGDDACSCSLDHGQRSHAHVATIRPGLRVVAFCTPLPFARHRLARSCAIHGGRCLPARAPCQNLSQLHPCCTVELTRPSTPSTPSTPCPPPCRCTLQIHEKLAIARQLSALGVDVCEAGFPVASPGDFDAVSLIAREIGPLTEKRVGGAPMVIAGLARALHKDIERCYEAVKHAPRHRIHTFLATSDLHVRAPGAGWAAGAEGCCAPMR